MKFTDTVLPGVVVVEPEVHGDSRGFFLETFHSEKYREAGITLPFVQDNHSRSVKGILRGLHYQISKPQGKLIYMVSGEIFDVAVDIRKGSPTFMGWFGTTLSAENKKQMYVPPGFAHGFCVLSETADVIYKCTDLYYPDLDRSIAWDDPDIGIKWPVDSPLLSPKDSSASRLKDVPAEDVPIYTP
ncbi:MAG: dTDP-4-dehydrorhamnose 3,5-epimerase [Thermodesulfovibrionales bacterium]|nr:dTDP-4-dehydrorhamnose 3,5-epimerase [Thermodesulfovibrionales bacterium]